MRRVVNAGFRHKRGAALGLRLFFGDPRALSLVKLWPETVS